MNTSRQDLNRHLRSTLKWSTRSELRADTCSSPWVKLSIDVEQASSVIESPALGVLVDAVLVTVWVVTRVVGVAVDGGEEELALASPVRWLDEAGGEGLTRAWLSVLPPSERLVTQAPYSDVSKLYQVIYAY